MDLKQYVIAIIIGSDPQQITLVENKDCNPLKYEPIDETDDLAEAGQKLALAQELGADEYLLRLAEEE